MDQIPNTAEAQRWLGIAEKLLATHDLLGSKTFAIRARESDPTLSGPDLILSIADTLIAADTPIHNRPDHYSVLQLPHGTADHHLIAAHHRLLSSLLNPSQNPFVFADQALALVSEAFSILSSPLKKSQYDNEITDLQLHQNPRNGERNKDKDKTIEEEDDEAEEGEILEEEEQVIDQTRSSDVSSFWTACPYCYGIYEYPRVYEECSLRCQTCHRAFHAVTLPAPPPIDKSSKDSYFCCWSFFPLGFSMENFEASKNSGGISNWSPFSAMFSLPTRPNDVEFVQNVENLGEIPNVVETPRFFPVKRRSFVEKKNVVENLGEIPNVVVEHQKIVSEKPKTVVESQNVVAPKSVRKSVAMRRAVVDDEDEFEVDSDHNEDSDYDWGTPSRKKKKAKIAKGKVLAKGKVGARKSVKKVSQVENIKEVNNSNFVPEGRVVGGSSEPEPVAQGGTRMDVGNVARPEGSKKAVANNTRRQTGKGLKELGKLDLNVEFSNEVEEHAPGMNVGNREEEGIEGIGFFEGLDEFLSSLPILSVGAGDENVKAA